MLWLENRTICICQSIKNTLPPSTANVEEEHNVSRQFQLCVRIHMFITICYNTGRIGPNGTAVTSAGQLPCSHIIHLDSDHLKSHDWTAIIESALMEADSRQIKSVSFPALGTGMVHCSSQMGWINNDD